ncbi:TM2 domain-containing protein 2 isoform X2 [Python bivittatus]|uniref:TM2 domain-containing protein 2 isoform X2 n=1 Tax=Python bivittatus TaxID=176946 RepID=A0A9F5IZP3_PYTBI|nr:TM2 domain-containing protein 2 isoform X2 [Python bivittatus]
MAGGGPVCYALLCGQAALLLGNLLLLQGVSRSHQHNATESPASAWQKEEGQPRPPHAASASVWEYQGPYAPLVLCDHLPEEFIECEAPVDHNGNISARDELGYGCLKFGGQAYSDVSHTQVLCRALDGIECAGQRTFLRGNKPCVKPLLLRPYRYGRGKAADSWRTRHLVVCGPDSSHYRGTHAQRWEQLVHHLLNTYRSGWT